MHHALQGGHTPPINKVDGIDCNMHGYAKIEHNKSWSISDHQSSEGKYFSRRYAALTRNVETASEEGVWQYFRSHIGQASTHCTVKDEAGRLFSGINLGSQDYLGLASNGDVHEAAKNAISKYGVHSSGAASTGGGSLAATDLAKTISGLLEVNHTLLFPTGWAAGYGAIKGIVRPHDFVVMDALAHNCLQHGAYASTQNVSLFIHNSLDSLRKRLDRIRKKNPEAAILVVFESLYSMDSDSPPLEDFITAAKEYDAHVLLDIAHDFGVLGANGRGLLSDCMDYSQVDIIIGSFSKVFASIGGFFSTNDLNLIRAVQGFSGSYTFSNFLIPPQIAAAQKALDIAFSEVGAGLRETVLSSCKYFRTCLENHGIETYGVNSAMIILKVGEEHIARDAYRRILDEGVIINCIEFPAVRKGEARFRIQITPEHSKNDLHAAAAIIADAIKNSENNA